MLLFQTIRKLFGLKTEIQDSPMEALDRLIGEEKELQKELKKAQDEFDEYANDLELKIKACDKLIEKGEVDYIRDNKIIFQDRLNQIVEGGIEKIATLSKGIQDKIQEKNTLESEILKGAIETTALLSSQEQDEIGKLIRVWEITGFVKGEEIDSQLKAIVSVLDIVALGQIEKAQATQEITLKKPSKVFDPKDHYANVIIKKDNKILFLKRAEDKVIAPGKYCLPGGHIDEGESIEEAGLRELKEEAGLTANYASIAAKAKCGDGKWAFYLYAYPEDGDIMLLDGESQNAAWMTEDEWKEANLLFDLKDHLIALECKKEIDISYIQELKKGEDALLEEEQDLLIKGKAASVGEKRTWGEIEYVKTNHGWIKTKDNDKEKKDKEKKDFRHSTEQMVAHAENTSTDQLNKIIKDETKSQHVRDAAKRELERREKEKKEQDLKFQKKSKAK